MEVKNISFNCLNGQETYSFKELEIKKEPLKEPLKESPLIDTNKKLERIEELIDTLVLPSILENTYETEMLKMQKL